MPCCGPPPSRRGRPHFFFFFLRETLFFSFHDSFPLWQLVDDVKIYLFSTGWDEGGCCFLTGDIENFFLLPLERFVGMQKRILLPDPARHFCFFPGKQSPFYVHLSPGPTSPCAPRSKDIYPTSLKRHSPLGLLRCVAFANFLLSLGSVLRSSC